MRTTFDTAFDGDLTLPTDGRSGSRSPSRITGRVEGVHALLRARGPFNIRDLAALAVGNKNSATVARNYYVEHGIVAPASGGGKNSTGFSLTDRASKVVANYNNYLAQFLAEERAVNTGRRHMSPNVMARNSLKRYLDNVAYMGGGIDPDSLEVAVDASQKTADILRFGEEELYYAALGSMVTSGARMRLQDVLAQVTPTIE